MSEKASKDWHDRQSWYEQSKRASKRHTTAAPGEENENGLRRKVENADELGEQIKEQTQRAGEQASERKRKTRVKKPCVTYC